MSIESNSEQNLCASGSGCCCHDVKMPLDHNEFNFMIEGGTRLNIILPVVDNVNHEANKLKSAFDDNPDLITDVRFMQELRAVTVVNNGQGLMQMIGDCGYLDRSGDFPQCTAYDDPDRPEVCQEFTPGNPHCISLRARDGIIDHIEWTALDLPQIKVKEQA